MDIGALEQTRPTFADSRDPQTLLADKTTFHSNCIYAMRLHADNIYLSWPKETAWGRKRETVRFCVTTNYSRPLDHKLIGGGNVT